MSRSHVQPWNLFNPITVFLFAVLFLGLLVSSLGSHFMVDKLPGFAGDLPFTLETGYIGVGESEDVQLFYYFTESEKDPENDPVLLWITGGPGCSALSAILYEIGPFTINYVNSTFEKPVLEKNPHSWTKVASIIFLDQPAGSGFSYAKTPEAYIANDTSSSIQAYDFIKKWLLDHPKFINNPFYVTGDSYMGILIPMIVQEILNGYEAGEEPHINFKGYVIGNPVTDIRGDYDSRITYAHRMALLSDEIYQSVTDHCGGEYLNVDPDNAPCLHDLQVVDNCLGQINLAQILEPICDTSNTFKSDLKTSVDNSSAILFQTHGCRDDNYIYSYVWANNREVRKALHIHEESENIEWLRCNESIVFRYGRAPVAYTPNVLNTVGYHRRFADKNCRALIYSGDHDMSYPYLSTLKWINSLNLPVIDDWRPWFVDKQVAGYTQKYLHHNYNLTFATVKGGGHTAPEYKPKECSSMITSWLANDNL